MISVNGLSIRFGGRVLFDDVSYMINKRDRIGLVGKNGAGKSTMLKILAGIQRPEDGQVSKPNEFTIGYLPQELQVKDTVSVLEETCKAFEKVQHLEKKLNEINAEIAERTDYESDSYMELLNDLNDYTHQYSILEGQKTTENAEKVLLGLGFLREDLERPTGEFSGGWRMRIELAKLLLKNPDLLLLDEPTNHLDIESIEWFEDFLKAFEGAVVLVSHDRAFLDNVTNRTIEISLGRIYDFKANYSKYLVLREEQREQQMAAYKNQQKEIEHTEKLIDKFRAKANKASMAQSLIKKLDRMDKIEVDEEDNSRMKMRFPDAPRSGKVVVEAKDAAKRYGDKEVFSDVNLMIARGEKIAFVGKNGMGKSTLSKMIVGELDYDGKIELGHNVSVGYFAQDQPEKLPKNKTVFQTIDEVAEGEIRKQIRSILGAFLFSGDDAEKKVNVLSGGEKSRLAMCQLLLEPHNLLVLDEPTNHLDMRSKDVLKEAIAEFEGTVILVSHDRYFLNGLVDKVYEFRKGEVKEHIGGVYEFLQKRKLENLSDLTSTEREKQNKDKGSSDNKQNYLRKKEVEKEYRNLSKKVSKAESKVEKMEQELSEMDEQLKDPEKYKDLDSSVFEAYNELKRKLEVEMENWEKLSADLEKVSVEKEKLAV